MKIPTRNNANASFAIPHLLAKCFGISSGDLISLWSRKELMEDDDDDDDGDKVSLCSISSPDSQCEPS